MLRISLTASLFALFGQSFKHHSKNRAQLIQLETTVIKLGFYLIRGRLKLLQTYLSEYTIHLFSVILFYPDVDFRIHLQNPVYSVLQQLSD